MYKLTFVKIIKYIFHNIDVNINIISKRLHYTFYKHWKWGNREKGGERLAKNSQIMSSRHQTSDIRLQPRGERRIVNSE